MPRAGRRWLLGCVAALLTLGAAAVPVQGQKSLRVERFDVQLTVNQDGTLDVLESITYGFQGSWNGVYRDVPINYSTPTGLTKRLYLEDVIARDDDGRTFRFETSRHRHYLRMKVWVPGAQNTSRTVNFHYTAQNALLFFDEEVEGFDAGYDELYWNATGDESEVPIDASSVMVVLPEGVTGARARVYTGRYGSQESDATIQETEDGFYFEATRGFQPYEGMTVNVAWDPGVVERPTALDRAVRIARANWILLIPLLSLWLMFNHWSTHGRDPEKLPISPQYEPPEAMGPAQVGTLVDSSPDMRDITATIVDLAVRGYVEIEEKTEKVLGIFGSTEFSFRRLRTEAEGELNTYEQQLMSALFTRGRGDYVSTDDLKNDFYTSVTRLKDHLFELLLAKGMYRHRPDKVIGKWIAIALVVVVLGGVFPALGVVDALGIPMPTWLITVGLTAVPIGVFGVFMPRRTTLGARTLEHILGFREFLNRVESDRFKRMITGPEMFEKYLPYAMALGVEGRWARAFEDIYTEPPDWYSGHHHGRFHAVAFTNRMGTMSTAASSAMTSQPRSSGGSGFSGGGGGFSGGGCGGGGTGGF